MSNHSVKLFQPPLLDFACLGKNDHVRIVISNREHKFATDAQPSGTDIKNNPFLVPVSLLITRHSATHPLDYHL